MTFIPHCLAMGVLLAAPHEPLSKLLPFGGKPKRDVRINDQKSCSGVVLGLDGNKAITVLADGNKLPLTLPTYAHLRSEKVRPGASEAYGYRIGDVRIGDIVSLGIYDEAEVDYCAEIRIIKRPGGRVPPSSIKDPDFLKVHQARYHDYQNAWNDWKDHGVPLPNKK